MSPVNTGRLAGNGGVWHLHPAPEACERQIPLSVRLQKAELKNQGWDFKGGKFQFQ